MCKKKRVFVRHVLITNILHYIPQCGLFVNPDWSGDSFSITIFLAIVSSDFNFYKTEKKGGGGNDKEPIV